MDPLGTAGVVTNTSAQVLSSNLYDAFGVTGCEQGSAQTPWRDVCLRSGEEGLYLLSEGRYAAELSKLKRGRPKACKKDGGFLEKCWRVVKWLLDRQDEYEVVKSVIDCSRCAQMVIELGRRCENWVHYTDEGLWWCSDHPGCVGNAVCCISACIDWWTNNNREPAWLQCISHCVDIVKKTLEAL